MPAAIASAKLYEPRCAEAKLLHRVVAEELDGFLAEAMERGHPLPRFVESTVRDSWTAEWKNTGSCACIAMSADEIGL